VEQSLIIWVCWVLRSRQQRITRHGED